jgi:invasion protein IalB
LPRGTSPGNATIRVRDVSKIDNQRIQIRVERAWGGSRPGKSTWRLQASYYQGTLYLRIPGGDLAMPKGVKPVVSPIPTTATTEVLVAPKTQKPVTPELKVAEPALPYNDGKIYESGAQVKTITPPLPKIPETISMTGPAGASRFGDWLRLCEKTAKGSECFLEALLYAPGDKKKFLLIRARPHATGKIAMQFIAPNEIALRPGLRLTVADKPAQQLSFEICRREHCEINFVLDQQQFSPSVDGMKMAAVYETFAGAKQQMPKAAQTTETARNPQAPQANPAAVPAQFAVSFLDFFRAIETPATEKRAPEKP